MECGDLVTDPVSPSDPSALAKGWRGLRLLHPERILEEASLEEARRRVTMRGLPPSCLVTQHTLLTLTSLS